MLFCLSEKHSMAVLCFLHCFMHHQQIQLAPPVRFFYSTWNTEQLKIMMKITTSYGVALYKLSAC